jgi:hypothetical protein
MALPYRRAKLPRIVPSRTLKQAGLAGGAGGRALAAAGLGGATLAATFDMSKAHSALTQDSPPFVLVSGPLLVGLSADEGGLFSAAGHALARLCAGGAAMFAGVTGSLARILWRRAAVNAGATPSIAKATRWR